ncbi:MULTISPECIES: hypothetical protein [Halorubrum]|nr:MULTISPECIES: hypothetical protein [Halorubrum]TKX61430.1 hypothetical protein EXE47_17915 [Halorubrum sp. GN12_10-3_MGM]
MAVIETDSEAKWIADAWESKSGRLRLRDALKEKHRAMTGVAVIAFAVAGIALSLGVDMAGSGDLAGGAVSLIGAGGFGWIGLVALDELDCQLRENHECRRCRKETNRWRADESEEGR